MGEGAGGGGRTPVEALLGARVDAAALPPAHVVGDEDADYTLGLRLDPPVPNLISQEADDYIEAQLVAARARADAHSQALANALGIPMRQCRDPVWNYRAEPDRPHPRRRGRTWFGVHPMEKDAEE